MGKHSEIVAGGTPNTAHSEYWNPKEIPWMSSGEINKKVIYTTDNMISKIGFSNSSAKWVKEKSVLIALAGQGKTRGTVAITEISLTTNQSIAAIQPDDSLYYKYLFQNLKGRYDELRNISSGDGTRGGLNKQIISDLIVLAPDMNEQRKIGDFLCNLDNLITLHQRNSADFVSRFFSDFTNTWEQRKLGDVADLVGGGTPSTQNPEYWDGDIDWYAPAEIANQIYVKTSQRKITEQGYDNSSAKLLPPGTVLFTSRAGIGKTAILARKGCTNQGFQSIVPHKNELDTYFIFSRTEELKRYGELVGAGSTFVEVSGKQMAAMDLMLPSTIQEQQMIGVFFKHLDNLITLHQCEYIFEK